MKNNILTLLFLIVLNNVAVAIDWQPEEIKAQGGTGYQINNSRNFEVDVNTIYKEDGEIIPIPNAQGGTGFKVQYRVSDTNPQLTTGIIDELNFINIYKGPVMSVSPVRIFDIEAFVNSQTFFVDDLGINDLQVGDEVFVSGYIDNQSSAIVTRIERAPVLSEWKISGLINELTDSQFKINNQVVLYTASNLGSCNSVIDNGDFVEIFASPIVNFSLGDVIDTVITINCVNRAVIPDVNDADVMVEGIIGELLDQGGFSLSGQAVTVSPSTKYIRGRKEDIQTGIKIEVEGNVDINTGIIFADKIRFLEDRINLTLPVQAQQLVNDTINVAGISLILTPQVIDPDGILDNGLNETTQIQFKGYDNGLGEVYVTRISVKGQVDYNGVKAEGYINVINQPHIAVFGMPFNVSTAELQDVDGIAITTNEFFSMVSVGAQVELNHANIDEQSQHVSGGVLRLVQLSGTDKGSIQLKAKDQGASSAWGVGTVTQQLDQLFSDSFE